MLSQFKSSAIALCAVLLPAWPASSADLAAHSHLGAQSRLGAVFADPPARAIYGRPAPTNDTALRMVETIYPLQPRLPGYYGRPRDFEYRNYYGTSPVTIFSRLPYACGPVGAC